MTSQPHVQAASGRVATGAMLTSMAGTAGLAPQVHVAAACPTEPGVEHSTGSPPRFNECLELQDGRMIVPARPGIGATLSQQARGWTCAQADVGTRPESRTGD